jgi:ariadne-1
MVVPHSLLTQLLSEAALRRYWSNFVKSFTDENRQITWCTRKGCEQCLVRGHFSVQQTGECICGQETCLCCRQEKHAPCSCDVARVWIEKESSESENTLWLQANTRCCPQCRKPIEKNGGCNYMRCQSCQYQFCWVCMQDWVKFHSDHWTCNKYETIK